MLQLDEIKFFESIIFIPYLNENQIKGNSILNIFSPFYNQRITPKKYKQQDFTKSILYEHIKNVICNNQEKLFKYMLQWIGHMIQKPNSKSDVSFCIQGRMGSGKDAFCAALSNIVGCEYTNIFQGAGVLFDRFNVQMERCILCILNEVSDGGSAVKKKDKLKGIVTQKQRKIERKGKKPYFVADFTRYIFNTNNRKWGLCAERDNRRYCFVQTNNGRRGDTKYFNELWGYIESIETCKEAFDFFSKIDLSDFNPRNCPETEFEKITKVSQSPPLFKFIFDILSFANKNKFIHFEKAGEDRNSYWYFGSKKLYHYYNLYMEEKFKGRRILSFNDFCNDLSSELKIQFLKGKRKKVNNICVYSPFVFNSNKLDIIVDDYFGGKGQYTLLNLNGETEYICEELCITVDEEQNNNVEQPAPCGDIATIPNRVSDLDM